MDKTYSFETTIAPSLFGSALEQDGILTLGDSIGGLLLVETGEVDALIRWLSQYSVQYRGIDNLPKSSSDLLRTSALSPTAQAWGEEG